ncbi:MAG: hypothetical protein HY614_06830 [Candidatus Rokubacteria bacterium]|nr:hypothetical protein [Candidatus Rokubacteria bacterium]
MANIACAIGGASRRTQIVLGVALVLVSSVLLKDWIEGLIYLIRLP